MSFNESGPWMPGWLKGSFRALAMLVLMWIGSAQAAWAQAGPPSAPIITSLSTADGPQGSSASVTVGFNPSANDGGSPVTYTVTSVPDNGAPVTGATGGPVTIGNLTRGAAYSFVVTATNAAGFSTSSSVSPTITPRIYDTVTIQDPGALTFGTSPTLTATATSGASITFASSTSQVCTITTGGTLTLLKAGTCSVTASSQGNSSYSPGVGTRALTVNPLRPGAPQITSMISPFAAPGVSTGSVTVAFSPPVSDGGGTINSYVVTANSGGFSATGNGSPVTVTGLTLGTAYQFTVHAVNASGAGPESVISPSITPRGRQTITFTNPGSINFGATATLSAATTSGLAVTLISQTTNVCKMVSPNQVQGIAPGTCTISATQGGDAAYLAATAVDQSFLILVPGGAVTITTPSIPAPIRGVAYSQPITASGGAQPYIYTETGRLPTGLTFNNGLLSGTVTETGTFSIQVIATDQAGQQNSRNYTFTVISPSFTFTPTTLPVGQVGVTYTTTTIAAGGGIAPYTYVATSSPLPTGLTLSPSGTLSGTPTAAGSYSVTITATDNFGATDSQSYTIAIGQAVPVAVNDTATVAANDVASIPVTTNDGGGPITSITVSQQPAHGSVTINGLNAVYTPAHDYFGTDSFQYTATGPGGTSSAATVSVTVARPALPVAAAISGVVVPYASNGTAINVGGSITGLHDSVAVATAPTHGTTSVAGDVITYTPTAGYFGTDSFTYTATGLGGTSAPATVSLTVATPPAPVVTGKSGVAIPYDSPGTAIDLSGSVGGVHLSIAIGTAPAHGSVTIAGDTVTYIPASGYFGADSFTFTAAGPGGTSTAATVGVVVATPPPPMAKSGSGAVVSSPQVQKSVDINLSNLVTGEYTSIELGSPPAHGTVTLQGAQGTLSVGPRGGPTVIATYAPASGFAGTDTFSFAAVGPGGRSAPATVTITVTGTVPTAAAKTAKAIDNQLVSVDLTDGATEGPFTAATIVSVSPADKATAKIVEGGSTTAHTYRLDVTPAAHFGGTVVVTYTLSNQFGTSAPATVTITVTARPDPSLDPNVRALSDAQAESTRRFAQSQNQNFLQRAERLHNGGGSSKPQMGISLSSSDSYRAGSSGYALGQRQQQDIADRTRTDTENDTTSSVGKRKAGEGKSAFSDGNSAGDGERRDGSIAVWTGGQIEIGTRDQTTDRDKISMTSGGLSAGADLKLSNAATIGIGGGVGFDNSKIGGQAAMLRGDSSVVAGYGSIAPIKNTFVDFVIGYGDLNFKSRRAVGDVTAFGSRDGTMWFGAASAGIDHTDGTLRWSLYGRGEWLDGTLGAYTESGAGIMNLRFDARDVSSLTGVLGGRFELEEPLTIGMFRPRLRIEWSHEFQDSSVQKLDYADVSGAAFYGIRTEGWTRNDYEVAMGGALYTQSRWIIDLELGLRGASGERNGRFTMKLSKEFW